MSIGLAFASRGRPDHFHKVLEQISAVKTEPDTFLSVRLDEDDPLLAQYKPANHFKGYVLCDVGPQLAKGSAPHINAAAMQAHRFGASCIVQVADDQLYEEGARGFDTKLKATMRQVPDGIALFYAGDGYLNDKQVSHPMVTRQWIDAIGFFYSPAYTHFWSDTELMEVAQQAGRLFYLKDISIKHNKHGLLDELYYSIRKAQEESDDKAVFEGRVPFRENMVKALKAKLKGPVVL